MCVFYMIFLFLFLGMCRIFLAFATDLKSRLAILENEIQAYSTDASTKSQCHRLNMKALFYELIQFHSDIKQLSDLRRNNRGAVVFLSFGVIFSQNRLANYWNSVYRPLLIIYFYFAGLIWCIALYNLNSVSILQSRIFV